MVFKVITVTQNRLKAWSMSNACVGGKELCSLLVDILSCGAESKRPGGPIYFVVVAGFSGLFLETS